MLVLDFTKHNGLVPAIVQDSQTCKVLMLGYMNAEAFSLTKSTKRVTFFSRSKQRIWVKGETSGNYLHVVSIAEDCDYDALLIKARPEGPTCHTGADTCWFEENIESVKVSDKLHFLEYLMTLIKKRKLNPEANSYTRSLFSKGINKVAQKVGEEAVELVIEAKDQNKVLFVGEAADLLFHYLVLLEAKDISLFEVIDVLQKRHASG